MKKCAVLLAMLFLAVMICFAADAGGKWSGTIALIYDVTVNLKEDNGKVSGVVSTEIGDIPLNNGVITGNDILFKRFTYNGFAVSYVKAKVNGDKMDVTIGFQGTSFQGTLTRVK